MPNSLLLSAVIAVIVVIVSGYAVSYSVGIDTVADIVFTGMLDAAYAEHGGGDIILNLTAAGSVADRNSLLSLNGAWGIAIFQSGTNTYAAVAASDDNVVQILNITDPDNIAGAGSITDNAHNLKLLDVQDIAIFESGGHTYAVVTSSHRGDTVQILNITDLPNINGTSNITNDNSLKLDNPTSIATFESGTHIYAAVAVKDDDGVQILNITNPANITGAGNITDDGTNTDSLELNGAEDIATFKSGGHTYAAVTAYTDDGVQILNITDPDNITAASSITNSASAMLRGAEDIAIFESGGHTYAAVAAFHDNAVQILNITDPYKITPAGNITDNGTNTDSLELFGAEGIAIFESGGHTYAAVAAPSDDGIQMLDITDPYKITPAGRITDSDDDTLELIDIKAITTFESGGHIYVAVTSENRGTVQIIRVDVIIPDIRPPVITLTGDTSVTVTMDTPYEDAGATCEDVVDGIAIPITPTSNSTAVDTGQTGQHTVIYSCVDAASNTAVPVSRTVIVEALVNLTATASITDDTNLQLGGAKAITIFESGGHTYAAVTAFDEGGVQILNITDPSRITAAGNITDSDDSSLQLGGANDIATFESGGHTYAAVTALNDLAASRY